jgi:hypothetical protein
VSGGGCVCTVDCCTAAVRHPAPSWCVVRGGRRTTHPPTLLVCAGVWSTPMNVVHAGGCVADPSWSLCPSIHAFKHALMNVPTQHLTHPAQTCCQPTHPLLYPPPPCRPQVQRPLHVGPGGSPLA